MFRAMSVERFPNVGREITFIFEGDVVTPTAPSAPKLKYHIQ